MKKKFSFKKEYRARSIFVIFNTIFFVLFMIAMIVPIIKVFVDSVDISSTYGLRLWPEQFSMAAYGYILRPETLLKPFGYSVFTTALGTFIGLLISTIGSYVLIQRRMPGVKIFSYLFMFTMIFNGGLVPTFLVVKKLGLMNTFWPVILPLAMNVYNLVLMRSFFEQIPESLFEAADIDGCSPFGTFIKIVLPLSKPALASIGLFYAVAMWSEYFHYILYITDPNKITNFQVKLREIVLSDTPLIGAQGKISANTVKNATVVVALLPFTIIYPFCQRYFITGVTMGAVKE